MSSATMLFEMSEGELRARDAELADRRLVSVAMYGRPSSPYYAAIWLTDSLVTPRKIVSTVIQPGMPMGPGGQHPQLLALQAQLEVKQFYPVLITATGAVGAGAEPGLRVALVGEKRLVDPEAVVTMRTDVRLDGDDPDTAVCVDSCFSTEQPPFPQMPAGIPRAHHFALFHRKRGSSRTAWAYRALSPVVETVDGVRASVEHKAIQRGWSRGHHAIPAPMGILPSYVGGRVRQVFVHYRDDVLVPWPEDMTEPFDGGTFIDGPLRREQLGSNATTRSDQGYWPIAIGANGRGSELRLCVSWARVGRHRPLQRHFVALDGTESFPAQHIPLRNDPEPPPGSFSLGVPPGSSPKTTAPSTHAPGSLGGPPGPMTGGLTQIDAIMRDALKAAGVHAAQLSVAKNGRLKIMRSYTWAEANYPVTQHYSKLRWASCSKFLLGLRVAAMGDPDFLEMTLPQAFQVDPNALPLANPDQRSWFTSTKVADLLRHAGGWQRDRGNYQFDYQDGYFAQGSHQLPLQPGDFQKFVAGSQLAFVAEPPGQLYVYNNAHFVALSELVSQRLVGRFDSYAARMSKWWADALSDLHEPMVIQGTREESLGMREVPLRGKPGLARATLVHSEVLPAGALPPHVPACYSGGRDLEMMASGFWSMSAVAMARILQGMHPGGDGQLLTWEQVLSMTEVDPGLRELNRDMAKGQFDLPFAPGYFDTDAVLQPSDHGTGGVRATRQSFAGHDAWYFAHSGAFPGYSEAITVHWAWEVSGVVSSLSFCIAATGPDALPFNALKSEIEKLELLGQFNDEADFFASLL